MPSRITNTITVLRGVLAQTALNIEFVPHVFGRKEKTPIHAPIALTKSTYDFSTK